MVEKGYKQTEIGIIPEDWEVKKLGDVCDINMGQSPDSKCYNRTEFGLPLIQGNADIKNRLSIKRVWTTQITKVCSKGDLIMTVRAPVGFIGYAMYDSCIGRGVCSFKEKNIVKTFFFYSMMFYEDKWKVFEQGSTFSAVNSNQIKEFQIPLPPLPEQQAIATVLSDMDGLIESLEKLISKKRLIKQGAMQELLTGRKRLHGFEKQKGYKQTEIGIIPEDWEVKKFGDVCIFKQGIQVALEEQKTEPQEGLYKLIRIENYTQNSNDYRYIKISNLKDKLITKDDIVVVRYGASAGFIGRGIEGIFANNLFQIKPNDNILDKNFLYVSLKSNKVYTYFQKSMFGGAMPALSFNIAKALQIPLPPLSEQTAIAQILSDMDSEIDSLEKKLEKYKLVKQGMMQELLTGKRRIERGLRQIIGLHR